MGGQIHRSVFQVEVFSRGPLRLITGDGEDPFDLEAINYAITDGDCIGSVELASSETVPPEKLHAELVRIGNDGTFFEEV